MPAEYLTSIVKRTPLELPSKQELQKDTPDRHMLEPPKSTVPAPSDLETPVTSRVTSEIDSTHPTVSLSSRNASRARFEGLHVSSWPSTINSTRCLTFETSSTQACLAIKTAALFAMILLIGSCLAGLYWISMPSTAVQDDHIRPPFLAVPPYRSKKLQTSEDYYSARSTPLVGIPSNISNHTHSRLRYRGLTRKPAIGSETESAEWSMATVDDLPSSIEQHITEIPDSWIRTNSNTSTKPIEPSTSSDPLTSPEGIHEKLQRNESRITKWLISKIPSATIKVKSGSAIQGLAEIGAVTAATAGGKAGQEEALEIPNECLNVSMPQNPQDQLLGSVASNIEAA